MTKEKCGWKLTTPKSKNFERDVLLPDFLIENLNKLKIMKKASDTDFIFGNGVVPISTTTLDRKRNYYCEAAGVKRIRIHDFRHSHASYLISINTDLATIAKRLGDTIEEVLKLFDNRKLTSIIVTDNGTAGGKLMGIITTADILDLMQVLEGF